MRESRALARWLRTKCVFSVSPLVSQRHYSIASVLRFQCPLIKPEVQISCLRLSDKASCVRPQTVARRPQRLDVDQSELLATVFINEA